MADPKIKKYRNFLKDSIRMEIDFSRTDQSLGIKPPPIEKPHDPDKKHIDLVRDEDWEKRINFDLISAVKNRESHRNFSDESLTLEELSFLLWATQGIKQVLNPATAFRVVPSAGCRHALETYLLISKVEGLDPGVYRYLPLEHQLLFEFTGENLAKEVSAATLNQSFIGRAPIVFVWTAIPYRMEWRYDLAAHKVIALDAGHVCQNLYLAAKAIGAGTCAIAAYDQNLMDSLLRIDGEDEFTIYLAPVGKIKNG
jgi:SagB-type dehydrogenase family enzyme